MARELATPEKASAIVEFVKRSPKPALFVGSGPSTDAGLDSWAALESKLRFALQTQGIDCEDLDVFQLANRAKTALHGAYNDILRESFRNPHAEPGELLELLASLRTHCAFIITSNYDKLLETAFRVTRLGVDPPVTTKLDRAKEWYKRGEFFVYKFNGDIDDPDSMVLASSDYATNDLKEIFNFLSTLRLLFVGYGFRDPILEHFRIATDRSYRQSAASQLFLLRGGSQSEYLAEAGCQVVTFQTFSQQKDVLQQVATMLVTNPFRDVYQAVSVPNSEVAVAPLFAKVRTSVSAVIDRAIILHENWENGWNAEDFEFVRKGDHILPRDALTLVDTFAEEVERPWRGKLAFTGLVLPLSERHGKILTQDTTWRKYEILWKKLDLPGVVASSTIRERWWLSDIQRQFEESELPHILCMHLAVISKDGQLLLTRKSRSVAFAAKRWCPSIEEQVANGRGEATEDSPIDSTPRCTCERGLSEELGIPREWIEDLRFYAFATDWFFSDAAVIGSVLLNVPACRVFGEIREHNSAPIDGYAEAFRDTGEFEADPHLRIQYRWTPARVDNVVKLLLSSNYGNTAENTAGWHPTAKLRLFAVMASMVRWRWATWSDWSRALEHQKATGATQF
jgi:hypothetical protein